MRYTAKEFCLTKPFEFAVRERVIDFVPKGYLLLKPVVAGVCGSDVLYFKGKKEREKLQSRLPMCLLHEGVAEIVESGEATRLKAGTKVIINPMIPCGQCHACRDRRDNLCQNSKYMAATADGLARTLFLYPEERVLPLPEGVELEVAALTEPFTIALTAFEESYVEVKDLVAVIGDGPVGYFLTLLTSFVGKIPRKKLYFIGIIDEKLSLAKEFASTINLMKENAGLNALYGTVDVCFEAVGGEAHRAVLKEAISLLKPGGKCILLGISMGEVPIEITKIVNRGLTFKGSMYSRMEHYIKVLELLRSKEFQDKAKRIISARRFIVNKVEDLTEAFKYADTEEGEAKTKPGRVLVYFP